MITQFKIFESEGYVSPGDIVVLGDVDYEIIQDMDDNNIWTYEHNEDGGSLAKHHAGTFNWWVSKGNDVKIIPVDKFIREYPKHKNEIMNIYMKNEKGFELVHDAWSKNKNFLIDVESEKYNL